MKTSYYHGIKPILFHFYNEWADPEVEYHGIKHSCVDLEEILWDRFYDTEAYTDDIGAFHDWIAANPDEVFCALDDMEANWYEAGYEEIKEAVIDWQENECARNRNDCLIGWETATKADNSFIEILSKDSYAGFLQIVLDIEDLKDIRVTWFFPEEADEVKRFGSPDKFVKWLEAMSYGDMLVGCE